MNDNSKRTNDFLEKLNSNLQQMQYQSPANHTVNPTYPPVPQNYYMKSSPQQNMSQQNQPSNSSQSTNIPYQNYQPVFQQDFYQRSQNQL